MPLVILIKIINTNKQIKHISHLRTDCWSDNNVVQLIEDVFFSVCVIWNSGDFLSQNFRSLHVRKDLSPVHALRSAGEWKLKCGYTEIYFNIALVKVNLPLFLDINDSL